MSNEIREVGQTLPIDPEGFIVNICPADFFESDKTQEHWKAPVRIAVEHYCKGLGDVLSGVFLRGSVAQGRAIRGISDIDTFAVVKSSTLDPSWLSNSRSEILRKFDFVTDVEFGFIERDRLLTGEEFWEDRFLVKTQSVCIWGEDVGQLIPSFRADRDTASRLHRNLLEVFARALKGIEENKDREDVRQWCRWVMKRIVRAGFTLVMAEEGSFTRDLFMSYSIFSKYFPDQSPEMYRALVLAIDPTDDVDEIERTIDGIGMFVQQRKSQTV